LQQTQQKNSFEVQTFFTKANLMMQQLDESIERSVQKAISHNQQSRNKENQIDKISKSLEGTDMTLQKLLARKADTDEIT
jgi:hypothetical protein